MNKTYQRINWENYPSDASPVNAQNLNRIDGAVDELDNRIIKHETEKATKAEVATLVANVEFEESTGIITVIKKNGSKVTIDTKMEKIAVNFDYDPVTQRIILSLIDGTKQYIDLSALITQYEFLDTDTAAFLIGTDGKVSAIVKEGSIEEKHLEPNYLARIKVEEQKAQASRKGAETAEVNANTHAENAKKYYEQAKEISESFVGALRPKGTVTFAELPTLESVIAGDMYNISNEFTTTDDFKEGSGSVIPAGANIYKTSDGKWDVLAGTPVTGVKGAKETKYRRGNVNLTPENIGAVATTGDASRLSVDFTESKELANISKEETFSGIFGKIAKAITSLMNHISNKKNPHAVTKEQLGLGNVDNTADSTKSVKYAATAGSANAVAWSNVSGKPSSMPASDVYAWAKASSKPGYSWNEIGSKPSTFPPASHTHAYIPTSASCNKNWNWSGQGGQPSWLWGSNDGTNMYVYNPSNFSVNYATTADTVDGVHFHPYDATGAPNGHGYVYGFQGGSDLNAYVFPTTQMSVHYADSAGAVAWGNVSGKPSSYNPSAHTHSYLPLNGGTITGNLHVGGSFSTNTNVQTNNGAVYYANTGTSTGVGGQFYASGNNTYVKANNSSQTSYLQLMANTQIQCRNCADSAWKPIYASAYPGTSARKYKENIAPLTDDEVKKILEIEVVSFDYKENVVGEEDRYNRRGVIADEVESIIPSVIFYNVNEAGEKEVEGVDYSRFTPYLIKMVQIQQEQINRLTEEISKLKMAQTEEPQGI